MIERGDICWVDFGGQARRRPALVLTPTAYVGWVNAFLVVPSTTKSRAADWSFELVLEPEIDRVPDYCCLRIDQLQVVAKDKVDKRITTLREDHWPEIRRMLLEATGFEPRAHAEV